MLDRAHSLEDQTISFAYDSLLVSLIIVNSMNF